MYELKNHMETVVREVLQEYIHHGKLRCSCERCQADIMALTLNRIPPRYAVSLKGEILTDWESRALPSQAKVMAELINAAKQVGESPSHPLD